MNAGGARWALLYGNFAIGCGVMVVAGSLNDITRSLQVSVAVGGQLISLAAAVMCFGAPVLASALGRLDSRRLLAGALAWYAIGHALCALMPRYEALMPMRGLCMLAAAVFTPQAAAAIGATTPAQERGRAITFVFLGWSLASVVGMPVHSYIGEALGWRWAFALVAVLAAAGAAWVWQSMPDGVQPPRMSAERWREVMRRPMLLAVVAVTALSGAGQFTVFTYLAPYYRNVLQASPAEVSALFLCFGAFGLLGNVLLSQRIDRLGAARGATLSVAVMVLGFLAWPLAGSVAVMAVVLVPWALGCFSSNSAQQARLGQAAPELAPALMALNTSAIYLGQAVGAASGGAIMASDAGYAGLSPAALVWLALAIGLSVWAARRGDGRA